MKWLSWLRRNWPGVRGRRLIYERVARLEARIVELQIQTDRNLNRVERNLTEAGVRVAETTAALGGLLEQIGKDRAALGDLIAETSQQVGALHGALSEGLAEAGRRGEQSITSQFDQLTAAISEATEHSQANTVARDWDWVQAIEKLDADLKDATQAIESATRDAVANWNQKLEHQLVILNGMDGRIADLLIRPDRPAHPDADSAPLFRELLTMISGTVANQPAQFAAVEDAAKHRHESLMSKLPTVEYFAAVLEAHRNETLARLGQFDSLQRSIDGLERIAREELERQRDIDVILGDGAPPAQWPAPFILHTDHPIAFESDDHRFPRGTANDNTRSPRFVAACERLFGKSLTHLDLGCAGGGLVRDFLIKGHRSMGLEGSDWSLLEQRAEWRTLGGRLRTCDITQPFEILDEAGLAARFDVISAWEVLEHLPRETLPGFFNNVRRHLAQGGIFVASVASFEDRDESTGAVWHVTLEPPEWWREHLERAGLQLVSSPFSARDYVRGSGSSYDDWDAVTQPHMGFHLTARARR